VSRHPRHLVPPSALAAALLAVTALGAPAAADEVHLADTSYLNCRIAGFHGGLLYVRTQAGDLVQQDVSAVRRIALHRATAFTEAEAFAAGGAYEMAAARYNAAAEKDHPKWVAALIALRRQRLEKLAGDGSEEPAPATQPTTAPATQAVRPEPASDPRLASPEAMARAVRPGAPANPGDEASWADLSPAEKQAKLNAYAAERRAWQQRHGLLGERARWRLTLKSVTRSEATGRHVAVAASKSGCQVTAIVPPGRDASLAGLAPGDDVSVVGTIKDYNLDVGSSRRAAGLFDASEAEDVQFGVLLENAAVAKGGALAAATRPVRPTSAPAERTAPPVALFGVEGKADCVVFVVDRSQSMLEVFDYIRAELMESVGELTPDQRFHVIFFAGPKPKENPHRRLIPATDVNKETTRRFIHDVLPSGLTDPRPALRRAFLVLRAGDAGAAKTVFLLTDGVFEDNDAVLADARQLIAAGDVRVHTLLVNPQQPPLAVRTLRSIAEATGGTYKAMTPGDAADWVRRH
jgi:hypothetical protein